MENKFLSRKEAADYLTGTLGLKTSPKTLAKLTTVGGSPKYRKFGLRRVVYQIEDLNIWAEEKLSKPLNNSSEESSYAGN